MVSHPLRFGFTRKHRHTTCYAKHQAPLCMVMGTHIQDEIIMDILIMMPVKSLLRFKSVSKSWMALISEPCFTRKHLLHAKNQLNSQKLLLLDRSDFVCSSFCSAQLIRDIRRLDIIKPDRIRSYCSCDGLFLMVIENRRERVSELLLWNPSTGDEQLLVLPDSELELLNSEEEAGDAFYGLGYDSISDDYKVFRVDTDDFRGPDEILALKIGSWKKIDYSTQRVNTGCLDWHNCLQFVHGAFHWICTHSSTTDSISKCIGSFNISEEMYGMMHFPEALPRSNYNSLGAGLSVMDEMLWAYYNDMSVFNLWVMKNYGVQESWTKLLTLSSEGVDYITPIYRFSNNDVLLEYNYGRRTVFRASEGTSGLSSRIWPQNTDEGILPFSSFHFTESLVSPKLNK